MTKKSVPNSAGDLSASEVARHLSISLGRTEQYWLTWLSNDRRANRVNRHLPPESGPGRPRYSADVVDAFVVEFKREQSQAERTGKTRSASSSSAFAAHVSTMTPADGLDRSAVLLVIAKPLVTFMLSASEARHLADRLNRAAQEIDGEVKP